MNSKKNLKRNLLICLLAGSAVMYTLPLHAATSVIGNGTLPTGENSLTHNHTFDRGNLEMTITQSGSNGIIKWDSFDVGGSATVNFRGDAGGYNVLNYVNGANASQIYGTINANNNGNIFIVNPAGVQIGNSAQINVGSLYVSNAKVTDSYLEKFDPDTTVNDFLKTAQMTNAALMSLGNINANKVTFEGNGRIVIDSERIKNAAGDALNNKFEIHTDDADNVIIGYEAYNAGDDKGTYENKDKTFKNVYLDGSTTASSVKGYMWVEDVKQLQAMDTNLGGNYALRNSIDATATSSWNGGKGFSSIGVDENGKTNGTGFTGKFDGIDYNIFGLTINRSDETNVGLFGAATNANIKNVTLVGGSIIGAADVGAIVGAAEMTSISNVTNSARVEGNKNIGGIVGIADSTTIENAINTGSIDAKGDNVGGLVGTMIDTNTNDNNDSKLIGNSYNLGNVSSEGHNVGGLVGHAVNSVIGNEGENAQLVYNRMDVTGAYNVGGIVGNMVGSIVQNAENSGTVLATGHTNGEYTYHTDETKENNLPNDAELSNGIASVDVNVANVGGIAGTSSKGSSIENVTNSGDVSSNKKTDNDYYDAGNVGGIVGSAVDTNIKNATNRENEVRGAHNVGGVAGYFGGEGTVSGGINDGGDIMATGARYNNNFVKEQVRPKNNSDEKFIIGNIGGVVGYMDGDKVYVTGSANRGTVHTDEPDNPAKVEEWQKAANVGGIVGKIDSDKPITDKNGLGENYINAAVSNSYNTGDVLGYTGIGGIAGMMYNGAIASSYNLGDIRTTRQSDTSVPGENEVIIDPINMGGIVGDTTEQSSASVYLYDVYNKGKIGDETYTYFGRHVGGIVGRLSGTVEKAYNTGAIYNGYNVVGGIAGWMVKGSIKNSFNTGNITVNDKNNNANSEVGGIVGAADISAGDIHIDNVYNLGTIRSFKIGSGKNEVGGIIGGLHKFYFTDSAQNQNHVYINNAYTTGNLYAEDGTVYSIWVSGSDDSGANAGANRYITTNTYYIKPENGLGFNTLVSSKENGSDNSNKAIEFDKKDEIEQYQYDENGKYYSLTFTQQTGGDVDGGGSFSLKGVDENGKPILIKLPDGQIGDWRIYDGNTPILNAFLPDSEKYFAKNGLTDNSNNTNNTNKPFNGSIQYGTAYDPLLTIINTDRDLVFNFGTEDNELSITNAAGLAVYGGGVTLNNFTTNSGSGYFGGTIYADGALNLNGGTNDIGLGSASDIYGSAVNIITDGKVTIYGDVTATGNTDNGTTEVIDSSLTVENAGDINIAGSDVDVYGTLTSASNTQGANVKIPGIEDSAVTWTPGEINNPYASMADIADRFAHTTGDSAVDGNITITANGTWNDADNDNIKDEGEVTGGNVNLYYGNKEQGLITTEGDLTVTGTGDVYVDSDLDIGGDMTLRSTGADSEVVLDITNIGQVRGEEYISRLEDAVRGIELTDNNEGKIINAILEAGITDDQQEASQLAVRLINTSFEDFGDEKSLEYFHEFMHHFSKVGFGDGTQAGNATITLNAAKSGNTKLTIDMWNDVTETYDLTKYDEKNTASSNNHTLLNELNNLNIVASTLDTDGGVENTDKAQKVTYIWVSSGEQLKGIQTYYDAHKKDEGGTGILSYNFALKGDINASDVEDYVAIGTGNKDASDNEVGFTGTFDGRGNRIIGLNVSGDDAGIFSTVGTNTVNNNDGTTTTYTGTVKDVNIYSGTFTGKTTAGAVAGVNNGRIEGIVTFGNTVTVTGEDGNAGGIVGINSSGEFKDDANDGELTNGIYDVESTGSVIAGSSSAIAGGLVGTNNGGLANSFSDSAVTVGTNVTGGTSAGLGGVVGINNGNVQYVDSLGVTNGGATNSSNIGGIIGTNNGNMYSGYNESIVSGKDNVGGIIGENEGKYENDKWNGGTVANVVNATGVTGTGNNVGGLLGTNIGSVGNGRNNGTITGNEYVGGLVGNNASKNSVLTNLVNDSSAAITGERYVGGIAGSNAGTITTGNEETDKTVNLINRGTITGQQYVGGVAGSNSGTITNANNDVELNVKDSAATDDNAAKYFGGIAGENTEDGIIKNATNTADVNADGATYVGGIVGKNDGTLENMAGNSGNVTGKDYVGGVAGLNNKDIDGVTASNDGVVKATKGGAGGIFAENTGNITNSTLINNKTVAGAGANGATGGIIGVNSGNISRTSLKNEVDGQVIGMNNVGGLIGKNTGKVEGGRDDADSYYKYQIYNNGVINVGTWDDKNNDGIVDDGEITLGGNGNNIGGLIGNNTTENGKTGSLTAGYNTGAINASGSTNVGGIAGSNAGTIDQVFNTVITADGKNTGTITGGTNVGGLVGNNSGTLSNAYNITGVTGNDKFGNAVGNNTGEITNIYASNTTGILIGASYENGKVYNAYSFVSDDKSATGVITGDAQKDSDSYEGFDFDTDGSGIWKNYDGYSNPLLKVFLTKAYYDSATGQLVAAADDFKAHQNAEGGLIFQGGLNNLWSIQIRFGNGNPNWLGYDLEGITYMPDKNWYYFLDDAPFDRNRDFRERKAEVNFVDGGMEI